jgi:hypothetical protein
MHGLAKPKPIELSPSVVCLVPTNAAELCQHISEVLSAVTMKMALFHDVAPGSCLLGAGVSGEPSASSEPFSSHSETTYRTTAYCVFSWISSVPPKCLLQY